MKLEERIDSLEVQVIACRLVIEALLTHASPELQSMLGHLAKSAPEFALQWEMTDLQIEQLRQQLEQMHSSSLNPDGDPDVSAKQ